MVRLAALLALGTLALGLAAPAPAAPPAKVTVAIAVNGQNLYSRGELGTGYLLTEARATGSFTLGAGKDTGFYKEFPVESLKLGLSLVSHYEGEAGKEPPPDRVLALTATRVVWYRVGTSGTYLKLEARVERSDFPGCAGKAVLNIKDERAGDRVEVACGKLGVTFLAPAASVSFATAGTATAAKTPKPDANAPTVYTWRVRLQRTSESAGLDFTAFEGKGSYSVARGGRMTSSGWLTAVASVGKSASHIRLKILLHRGLAIGDNKASFEVEVVDAGGARFADCAADPTGSLTIEDGGPGGRDSIILQSLCGIRSIREDELPGKVVTITLGR